MLSVEGGAPPQCTQLHDRVSYYKVPEVVSLLWSFSRLGYHPGRALHRICSDLHDRLGQFNEQSLCNLLWALAVLQATSQPIFEDLIRASTRGDNRMAHHVHRPHQIEHTR